MEPDTNVEVSVLATLLNILLIYVTYIFRKLYILRTRGPDINDDTWHRWSSIQYSFKTAGRHGPASQTIPVKTNNYSDFIKDPEKIPTPQTMRISLENNAQIPKRCIMQDWLQTVIGKVRKKAKHRTVDL